MGEGFESTVTEETKQGVDHAVGDRRTFAQALQRPLPQSKYRVPLRKPEKINGDLGFVFSDVEMERAAEDLKFALVLKFTSKRPPIDVMRMQIIKTWGFSEVPMMSFMNNYHVLLHLANENDYLHAWAREGRVVAGCQFRLFNWTVDFDVSKEPSVAPQWIFLPGLPLHLYRMDCLQSFATRFGRFLGTDNATLYRTRATGARFCVEVDLKEELVAGFPIVIGQKSQIWQEVVYEKRGFYCNKCARQGHTDLVCKAGLWPKSKTVQKTELKVGGKKNEHHVWKEVGRKQNISEEEAEKVEFDDQVNLKNGQMVVEVVDKGKQIVMEKILSLNTDNRLNAGGSKNMVVVDVVDVRASIDDDSVGQTVVNEEGPTPSAVRQDTGTVIDRVRRCSVEQGDGERLEEEVPCNNRFEILSEEDNPTEVEYEKDYCSDPGTQQCDSVNKSTKDVVVRKSSRAKVQPSKLNL